MPVYSRPWGLTERFPISSVTTSGCQVESHQYLRLLWLHDQPLLAFTTHVQIMKTWLLPWHDVSHSPTKHFFCLVVLMEGGIGPFVCNEVIGWLSYYGQIRVLLLKVEYSRDESIKLPGAKWRPIFIIAVNSKNEHRQWIRHSRIIRQAVSRQHLIGWSPLTGRLWGAWSDICKFAGISRAF